MLSVEDRQTGSVWSHSEGVAVNGPMKGELLERIPTYHMTWGEWKALHPETRVIIPVDDPVHKDPRHGHGSEEYPGRPGISPNFVRQTLMRPVDTRLAENAMVLALTCKDKTRIYPLEDVWKEGGVVNDVLADEPVVVWAGPQRDSFGMAAFSRRVEGKTLTFQRKAEELRDTETQSTWLFDGRSSTGPSKGCALEALDYSFLRWHGWAFAHRKNDIYVSRRAAPEVEAGAFESVLLRLTEANYAVEIEGEVVNLQRPNEAIRGITLTINDERFHLSVFPTRTAAEDYTYATAHTLRFGRFVLQSDPGPEARFATVLHTRLRPDDQIAWARLLDEDDVVGQDFQAFLTGLVEEVPREPGLRFRDVLEGLREKGYEVQVGVPLPMPGVSMTGWMGEATRIQLRVGARNMVYTAINGDRFGLYLFQDEKSARAYATEEPHTLVAGCFVLRSVPDNMFYVSPTGAGDRPDEEIHWSILLKDATFSEAFRSIVAA